MGWSSNDAMRGGVDGEVGENDVDVDVLQNVWGPNARLQDRPAGLVLSVPPARNVGKWVFFCVSNAADPTPQTFAEHDHSATTTCIVCLSRVCKDPTARLQRMSHNLTSSDRERREKIAFHL